MEEVISYRAFFDELRKIAEAVTADLEPPTKRKKDTARLGGMYAAEQTGEGGDPMQTSEGTVRG